MLNGHCEGCPLKNQPIIPGIGPDDAEIAIVGEAPGATEAIKRTPFVGQSGQLLRNTLVKVNIDPLKTFITNAVICRPPGNETPTPDIIERCRKRLVEELRCRPIKLVLSLGNTPMRSLLKDNKLKITQERGRPRECKDLPGAVVLPTFHPALILRQRGAFKPFVEDLQTARKLLDEGVQEVPEPKYRIVKEEEVETAVDFLLRQAKKSPYFAADIETGGFNPRKDEILCLGVCYKPGYVVLFEGQQQVMRLKRLFSDASIKWVWHNGKFDTAFLRTLGLSARVDEDVILLHYSLVEDRGTHDLKQLARVYLGADAYEDEVKKYLKHPKTDSYRLVPKPVLHKYCVKDCDYTRRLFDLLLPKVQGIKKLESLYRNVLLPASHTLQEVEKKGIYVDPTAFQALKTEEETRKAEIEEKLFKAIIPYWNAELYVSQTGAKKVPARFNPASNPQVRWLLFSAMKLRPTKKIPGKPNTREETLKALPANSVTPILLEYRGVAKTLSTYVYGIEDDLERDGRAHSTFIIFGTQTGRLASRNPNMQNITRGSKIRTIFQAPPGRILVEADYNQAELRTLAALSRDEWLCDVYATGRKLHDEVAVMMYGPKENYTKEEWVEKRIRAKAVNFGIAYGRKEESLMAEFSIPYEEAHQMIEDWYSRMPKAHKFLTLCRNAPLEGKVLVTPLGRRRRFGLVTEENKDEIQNEASNFPIQSTASDMTLLSTIRLQPILAEWMAYIVNLVHDSILVEIPDNLTIAKQVMRTMHKVMVEVPREILGPIPPFDVDFKLGRAWGQMSELERDFWDPSQT